MTDKPQDTQSAPPPGQSPKPPDGPQSPGTPPTGPVKPPVNAIERAPEEFPDITDLDQIISAVLRLRDEKSSAADRQQGPAAASLAEGERPKGW